MQADGKTIPLPEASPCGYDVKSEVILGRRKQKKDKNEKTKITTHIVSTGFGRCDERERLTDRHI